MPEDSDDLPSYSEILELLDRISAHALKLPPALAIDLQKLLARFPSDEVDELPKTP